VSRYKPYLKYKESGVEWLGEVPEHWESYRIDWVSTIVRGNTGFKKDELLDAGDFVALQYGKTYKVDEINNTFNFYVNSEFFKNSQVVHRGDTILISTSETIEDLGHSCFYSREELGLIGGEQILLKANSKLVFGKYVYYYSTVFCNELRKYATGLKVFRFNIDDLKNIFMSMPPLSEQTTIANYLDKATAKIDTLIQKQERLIELLKEKRQALISHTVTKGLDPNVKMKDSEVEWIGEVPKHWEIKKFKYLFQIKKRIAGKLGYDILSITQKGIKVKDIESGAGQLSSDYSKYQHVRVGDYAMNHMDLLTGFVDLSQYDGVTSPDYRVFSLVHTKSSPDYYLYLLQMGYLNKLFYPFGQGSSHLGRWRLPTEAFNEFLTPCPPKQEQEEIAQFIQQNLHRFDMLTKKANEAIALLKERRTALISAVVTGKIDVRKVGT